MDWSPPKPTLKPFCFLPYLESESHLGLEAHVYAENIRQIATSITQKCLDEYNGDLIMIPEDLMNKHGKNLTQKEFNLQANVTHISGRKARGNVMQLSVDKECHALAVVLLDRINISYKLIPRTDSTESIDKDLADHEHILGPQLTAFIDNWNDRLTFENIPHYRNGSLQKVIQTSRASNGEGIFSHILQTRATTVAILVEPNHVHQAIDILQDLVKYAQRALDGSRAQPILRTRGLKIYHAPDLAPVRESKWTSGPPPQASQTSFQPTNSDKASTQGPIQQQPSVIPASIDPSSLTSFDMMSDTLDKKLDSKLDAFTAAIASSVQTGFSAIQTSLDTVNTNVNGLTHKVNNLFLDMGKQQQVTTELKGKVSTLEHGFLELTQTVRTLKAASPPAISYDTNVFQDQLLLMTNSITNSFRIAVDDIHNRPTNRPTIETIAARKPQQSDSDPTRLLLKIAPSIHKQERPTIMKSRMQPKPAQTIHQQ